MTIPSRESDATVASLEHLSRDELVQRWATEFGCPAPRRSGPALLQLALAWRYQMKASSASGGVVESHRIGRELKRATVPTSTHVVSPGTRLLREWQGQTHTVLVTSAGFEYGGSSYRSLSAIARHITGTAWSGPLFFGLRK